MLEKFLRYLLALTHKHLENIAHVFSVINRIMRSLRVFITIAHHPCDSWREWHISHNLIDDLCRDSVAFVNALANFSNGLAVLRTMIPDIGLNRLFEFILYRNKAFTLLLDNAILLNC